MVANIAGNASQTNRKEIAMKEDMNEKLGDSNRNGKDRQEPMF